MNAARSIDTPDTPADAAAHAAASLTRHTPAANTPDARAGWMAAYDASTCAREFGQWGVTFANSIKRAIDAGDTDDAHHLACIQQYVFDHQFSIASGNADEAHAALDALKAGQA